MKAVRRGLDFLHALESHFPGVEVECVVRFGDPVTQILEEADTFGADLVVVGTGGRSGIGRTLMGSVAEKVFDRATVPVMLVRVMGMGVLKRFVQMRMGMRYTGGLATCRQAISARSCCSPRVGRPSRIRAGTVPGSAIVP